MKNNNNNNNKNSLLLQLFIIFLFFLIFYRIPIFNTKIYISMIVGVVSFLLMFMYRPLLIVLMKIHPFSILLYFYIIIFSFALDLLSGTLNSNPGISFTVRIASIFVMNVLPALLITVLYLKGSNDRLKDLIFSSFFLQTVFWGLTFIFPEAKIFVYSLASMNDSVNLEGLNFIERGFGYTPEINFTSPFTMALVIAFSFGISIFSILVLTTQLFNSNNVIIAFAIGFFARLNNNFRRVILSFLLLICLLAVAIIFISDDWLPPRFRAEMAEGGLRTINYLIDDHIQFLNSNIYEWIFGTSSYVFQGMNNFIDVDSGWIILINYGGYWFSAIILLWTIIIICQSFDSKLTILLWLIAFAWLNTKGLIISPNSFYFIIFIFLFNKIEAKEITNYTLKGCS